MWAKVHQFRAKVDQSSNFDPKYLLPGEFWGGDKTELLIYVSPSKVSISISFAMYTITTTMSQVIRSIYRLNVTGAYRRQNNAHGRTDGRRDGLAAAVRRSETQSCQYQSCCNYNYVTNTTQHRLTASSCTHLNAVTTIGLGLLLETSTITRQKRPLIICPIAIA